MTILSDATPKEVTGAALIETLKKRIGTAALAGALVPLAMAGASTDAEAGFQFPERSSFVEGQVTPENGQFRYSFEVFNNTDFLYGEVDGNSLIVNWELPLFSLNGIDVNSITSPENWTYEVIDIQGNVVLNSSGGSGGQSQIYNNENGPYGEYVWDWTAANDPVFQEDNDVYGDNPDQFEEPPLILHWFTEDFEGPANPIFEQNSLDGFSFLAEDGATNAPYQASWLFEPPTIGDPPIPQGNLPTIGVPNNAVTNVSEPGMFALFGAGLLGLIGLRRRRKSV